MLLSPSVLGLLSMLDICVVMLRLMLRRVFALPLLGRNSNLSFFSYDDKYTTGLDT